MTTPDAPRSLQDIVDQHPDLVGYLYDATWPPSFRGITASHIPAAFSNWRDEQRAWRESAILFDQSHHMPELFLSGPDALALLQRVGINSFEAFSPDKAKQLVGCTPRGHVIGDCILYHLADAGFELVSGMPLLNWVEFQARLGGFDVEIRRDNPTRYNATGTRTKYRFQLDGPNAGAIFDAVVDGGAPDIPFFRTARVTIGQRPVLVLRHGMAGHHGVELSGPFADASVVRDAILAAGRPHGLVQGGTDAYFSTVVESGWLGYPLPGIYTGDELRPYRRWLSTDSWEATFQLGGSFRSPDIEDYYVTPWDLGYERLLKLDHDHIGRDALTELQDVAHRTKVTLVWNTDDVVRVYASQFGDGPRLKAIDFPVAGYGEPHFDEVRGADGQLVGLSSYCGYSGNEGAVLSLAMLDASAAGLGSEVTVVWGERDGGSRKRHVETHEATQIRATVAPAPYATAAREMKTAA